MGGAGFCVVRGCWLLLREGSGDGAEVRRVEYGH